MLLLYTSADLEQTRKIAEPILKGVNSWDIMGRQRTPPIPGEGEVLLAMGNDCVDQLKGDGIFKKNLSLSSLRGRPTKVFDGGHILVTFSPFAMRSDAEAKAQIQWDIQLARRLILHGNVDPVLGDYSWLTLDEYEAKIDHYIALGKVRRTPLPVAFDLETMGLFPYYPDKHIVTAQLTGEEGKGFALHLLEDAKTPAQQKRFAAATKKLMTSAHIKIRGANLKFDLGWLREKHGIVCTNFSMDTLLVGSLLDENRRNSLSWHTKEHTDLGGYDCVAPDTRLLMADFTWKAAGEVLVGDELVGFDEHPSGDNGTRRIRLSKAEATGRVSKPCLRVTLDTGESVVCSEDHLWIARPRSVETGAWTWRTARDLRLGTQLRRVVPGLERGSDFDHGWMAGFLDGEGYASKSGHETPEGDRGFQVGWSQKQGPVFDKARQLAESWGLKCSLGGLHGGTNDDVATVKLNQWDSLTLLMRTRPTRLIEKRVWDGGGLPVTGAVGRIVKLEHVGVQEVVALKTSTATFVAEGICSHNSEFDATHDKSHMELYGKDEPHFLTYAAGDGDAALRVSNVQLADLQKNEPLLNFYVNLLHPGARAFEAIEHRGLQVDVERYQELEGILEADMALEHKACLDLMPARLKAKHAGKLNLSKAALVADFLFHKDLGLGLKPLMETAKGKVSTAKAHLEMFQDHEKAAEFLDHYLKWTTMAKIRGTYVEGFLSHLRPDGRFHPTYMLFNGALFETDDDSAGGTVTGRTSAQNPAMQTLPKHKKPGMKDWPKLLRRCFTAPPGFIFFEADFSQGELRIIAVVANERVMLDAYKKGLDLHCMSGATRIGWTYDDFMAAYRRKENKDPTLDPEIAALITRSRQGAKAGNFGLSFGMQPPGFQVYARNSYGLKLSLNEAEEIHEGFFKTYPGLITWHEEAKRTARRHLQIVSPLGRVRHLPMIKSLDRSVASAAERQAINSPVQGTLSDMCIMAITALEQEYGDKGLAIAGMTHDSIYGYMAEDKVSILAPKVTETMANLPLHKFGWNPPVDFPADLQIGPSWGELENYKAAA